jgi:TRAP-type C4-dicarboxylate transport system permease small subunit
MNSLRIAALVLIVAGVLGLAYGGFSYTRQTHEMKIGPLEMSMQERQTINVPVWAGVGAILIGGGLLFFGGRKA